MQLNYKLRHKVHISYFTQQRLEVQFKYGASIKYVDKILPNFEPPIQIWEKRGLKSEKLCVRILWMFQSNLTGVSKEISAKFVLEIHF